MGSVFGAVTFAKKSIQLPKSEVGEICLFPLSDTDVNENLTWVSFETLLFNPSIDEVTHALTVFIEEYQVDIHLFAAFDKLVDVRYRNIFALDIDHHALCSVPY